MWFLKLLRYLFEVPPQAITTPQVQQTLPAKVPADYAWMTQHNPVVEDNGVERSPGYSGWHDPGFYPTPLAELLHFHEKRITAILQESSFDGCRSRDYIRQIIELYIAYVHHLPATESANHRFQDGLAILGLEMGMMALRRCHGTVFCNAAPNERQLESPKWVVAAFWAAIWCEVYRIHGMYVLTRDRDELESTRWNFNMSISLHDFLFAQGATRYWVRWIKGEQQSRQQTMSAVLAAQNTPAEIIEYMSDTTGRVTPYGFACRAIVNQMETGETNPIANIVMRLREHVIRKDLATTVQVSQITLGHNLPQYVMDAIRTQIKLGIWAPNMKSGCFWVSSEGAFLVWKTAGPKLLNRMMSHGVPMTINDDLTLLDAIEQGRYLARNDDGSLYWRIQPPNTKSALDAVKFLDPLSVLSDYETISQTVEFRLLMPQAEKSASKSLAAELGMEEPETVPSEQVCELQAVPTSVERPPPCSTSQTTGRQRQSARSFPRLSVEIEGVLDGLRARHRLRQLDLLDFGPALGVPRDQLALPSNLSMVAFLAGLSREQLIWVEPGQARKFKTVEGQGEYLALSKAKLGDYFERAAS